MKIRNFLFHRVTNEIDKLWPPMPPAYFDKVIRMLTKKFNVVPLEDFLDDPSAFQSTKNIATVLFDDGYKDNIEYAAPILKKYNCPASFYVVTDCIDNNIPTWTYILDHRFQNTIAGKIQLDYDWLPAAYRSGKFANKEERLKFGAALKPLMKKMTNEQRTTVYNKVLESFNDVKTPQNMMNWDDIRQLQNGGYIIGSHTVTHPLLATIEKDELLNNELSASAKTLEQETGKFPRTISYPIGSYDDRVKTFSHNAGYKYGLVVDERFYNPAKDDVFAIPRVELYPETSWKTNARVSGTMELVKKFIR